MNIYVRIEVLSRELQGRLLLALVAAERGHRVLIGKHNRARVIGGSGTPGYPPGLFHDKSLGHSDPKTEMKKVLMTRGWALTAQDEEHGLVTERFGEDMLDRFPREGFDYNHLLFAWGDFDGSALHSLLPSLEDRIPITGSPRVDFWRRDLADAHDATAVLRVTGGKRFILINPIGGWDPGGPEAVFGIDGSEADVSRIEGLAANLRLMSAFIQAADNLAAADPSRMVVIRPHPAAPLDVWLKAADRCRENVVVSREARLTPWIQRADAVVTNGSTVAFEALLLGTPHITFAPDGHFAYDAVTRRIGKSVTSASELINLMETVSHTTERARWYDDSMKAIVHNRFAALSGPLAADRIVDSWESLGRGLGLEAAPSWSRKPHLLPKRRTRTAFRSLPLEPASRTTSVGEEPTPPPRWVAPRESYREKFPALRPEEIHQLHAGLRAATGRFADIRIEFQHDRLLLVTRNNG